MGILHVITGLLLFILVGGFMTPYVWTPLDTKALKGERVIVTGASKGIGREMALEYAKHGARIVVIARTESKLVELAKECMKLGATDAKYISADLSSNNDTYLMSLVDQSAKLLGAEYIDTLVLNHVSDTGAIFSEAFFDIKDNMQVLRNNFNTNAFSYMAMGLKSIEYLVKSPKGGRLVVVSSGAGIMETPHTVPYNAAKHSLHGFFNALRLDLALKGGDYAKISVTITVLGSIDTETARSNTVGILSQDLPWWPADECARAIMRAAQARKMVSFYPFFEMRFMNLFIQMFHPIARMIVQATAAHQ